MSLPPPEASKDSKLLNPQFLGHDTTPIEHAILTQNLPLIHSLLLTTPSLINGYVDINNNTTALIIACLPPILSTPTSPLIQLEIVKLLLKHGARINEASGNEWNTPLHIAVANQNIELVKLLLENGGDQQLEQDETRCDTVLEVAIPAGNVEIVRILLDSFKDGGKGEIQRRNLLHCAAKYGNAGVLKVVLEKCGREGLELRDHLGWTPLLSALWGRCLWGLRGMDWERGVSRKDREEVVMVLVDEGADLGVRDGSGRNVWLGAAMGGCRGLVKRLLDGGWDVNDDGKKVVDEGEVVLEASGGRNLEELHEFQSTALHLAAQEKYKDIVEILIEHGADVDAKDMTGSTPLHCSIPDFSFLEQVHRQKQHSEISDISSSTLQRAEVEVTTSTDIAKILLDNGAEIDATNRAGNTTLNLACEREEAFPLVKMLIDHGATINIVPRDSLNFTAILDACMHESTECLECLLQHGADIEIKSELGSTPLMVACQAGREEMVEVLLRYGADMNARNERGRTPLVHAAWAGKLECMALLKEAGADVGLMDNEGRGLEYWVERGKERERKIREERERPMIATGRGRGKRMGS